MNCPTCNDSGITPDRTVCECVDSLPPDPFDPVGRRQRIECRILQDRWLSLGTVKNQIRNYGEQERIAGPTSPTLEDVRRFVLADWRQWFNDFFT